MPRLRVLKTRELDRVCLHLADVMQQRAGRDERDVAAHGAHRFTSDVGDLAAVEQESADERMVAARGTGCAREPLAEGVVGEEQVDHAAQRALHLGAPGVDARPEFVDAHGDALQELVGVGRALGDHARRHRELELLRALVELDRTDHLYDLTGPHALDLRHMLLPDVHAEHAGRVAELEDHERIAALGDLVVALAHEEFMLDAVAGGEAWDVERSHETSAQRPWWNGGSGGSCACGEHQPRLRHMAELVEQSPRHHRRLAGEFRERAGDARGNGDALHTVRGREARRQSRVHAGAGEIVRLHQDVRLRECGSVCGIEQFVLVTFAVHDAERATSEARALARWTELGERALQRSRVESRREPHGRRDTIELRGLAAGTLRDRVGIHRDDVGPRQQAGETHRVIAIARSDIHDERWCTRDQQVEGRVQLALIRAEQFGEVHDVAAPPRVPQACERAALHAVAEPGGDACGRFAQPALLQQGLRLLARAPCEEGATGRAEHLLQEPAQSLARHASALEDDVAVVLNADLALKAADAADARHDPDGAEFLDDRLGRRLGGQLLERVLAALPADVCLGDPLRAFARDLGH